MKKLTSTTEELIENVNYKICKQTTFRGVVWYSYNASIGSTSFSCLSLEQLKEKISNYKFKTTESRLLTEKAVNAFGTNA